MLLAQGCAAGSTAGSQHQHNDRDALTTLASESLLVESVDVEPEYSPPFHVTKVLQRAMNGRVEPSYYEEDAKSLLTSTFSKLKSGGKFIVFLSYDRGGSCLAATFKARPNGYALQTRTLLTDFGPDAPRGYQLAGRFLAMPRDPTLEQLTGSLYPTGGELDATNTGESWCPGP